MSLLSTNKNIRATSADNDGIVHIHDEDGVVKGFHYKGNEFVHHTGLHHLETAFFNLVRHQKVALAGFLGFLALMLLINWHVTIITFFALLTALYFFDLLFNAFIIFRSYKDLPEITVTPEQIAALTDDACPTYTIFCPLYKEWQVVPQFVDAMQKLEYPAHKLQIIFLLEENDEETIEKISAADLPPHFQIVVVPHSKPKTKPKAMNYGLKFATGEYLVVYDAEDVPDPDQLKKAVIAFTQVKEHIACIQAKLNFYNPRQNLLTRLFTAEYSLWFDLVLPGFQSIDAPIPLGGTSNHFRTHMLRKLEGWDAFNVTEDCDLGMRLAKRGYRTAIIDSTTHEEANSGYFNWYSQRSRWIKGYIQTYFVHMRNPQNYFKQGRAKDFFLFQLIVGGKIISLFINPIMWGITICYFLFRAHIGGFIETFFPDPILYMGVFSLIVGNFLYLYYYMVGCVKRGHDSLIKYVFLVPFYWLAISAAAWRGVYEIVVKPHYWAKTVHGLHLSTSGAAAPAQARAFSMAAVMAKQPPKISNNRSEALLTGQDAFVNEGVPSEPVVAAQEEAEGAPTGVEPIDTDSLAHTPALEPEELPEEPRVEPELVQILEPETDAAKRRSLFLRGWDFAVSSAGMLVLSAIAANFLNFIFNAYLGRHLDLDDFGVITTVSTFVYILNLFVSSIGTTVTHAVSYLEGKSEGRGAVFFRSHMMAVFFPSIITSVLWIAAVPFVTSFLHIPGYLVVASFAPAIFFGMMKSYNNGYLQGTFSFGSLAFLAIFEALAKLALAVFFVQGGFEEFVSLAVPGSIVITWVGSMIAVYYIYAKSPKLSDVVREDKKFPLEFFSASFMRGLSVAAFLSVDVILAKHYLPPADAGLYSMLSLLGKMIFFFGTLLNVFIVTLVSRAEGEGRDPRKQFSLIFGGTLVLTLVAGFGLSGFGPFLVPFLLGDEATLIVPYLWGYSAAMMLFTLSTTIVLYRLAREQYIFPVLSLLAAVAFIFGIAQSHTSIDVFVGILLGVNLIYFVAVLLVHLLFAPLVYVFRNIRDLVSVFKRLPIASSVLPGHKRILIFNWRDSESVYAGGAETYIHALAERWVASGHSVTLFTSNDGKQEQDGVINGVRVIRRGGFFAVYALAPLYYLLKFRGEFDVIIDCENGIPFFMPLFAKEPVYCLLHHIHQEVFRSALVWPLSSFASFLEGGLMPLVYRNANFITVSESSKEQMERLNITRKDIFVVHPGVDLSFLRPGVKSATPLVAYIGRLKYYKSVDVLIEAFAEVRARIPAAKLVIAGDGDDSSRLKQIAQECELGDSVEFLGKVTEEKKLQLMQEAWVVVNPSMMEGWGITTIEANACGTPVVASDVPGLRDSVRNAETGVLVPYGESQILAEQVSYLLSHKEAREQMAATAQTWANNFDWEKSSNKFIEILSTTELVSPVVSVRNI